MIFLIFKETNLKIISMKSKCNAFLLFALFAAITFFACKEEAQKEEPTMEVTEEAEVENKAPEKVSIEPELHPFNVGSDMINVIGDTLGIQMYTATMKPGDSIGLHKHLDHTVYVLKGGKMLVYFGGSDPVEMDLEEGVGFVSGPVSDAAVNVGDTDIVLLSHEILRPRND